MTKEEDQKKIYNTQMSKAFNDGITQGIAQGFLQGEKENSIEIAKRMLQSGESEEKIQVYTGLSKKEIESLL